MNQSSSSQSPLFIPPDQGTYRVSLTVTDTEGAATTVVSGALSNGVVQGGTAADGTAVPTLTVANAPPLVNALNLEVLAGEDLSLVGRFLDSGWLDTHSAVWIVEGLGVVPASDTALEEDHKAALGTGIVTGIVRGSDITEAISNALSNTTLPARLAGNLRVTDNSGEYRDDIFVITVLSDDPNSRESNGTLDTAPILTSDTAYLSYIQSQGDIDIFEIKWPGVALGDPPLPGANPSDAQPLPTGTEVLVTLRGLPANYDLALLTQRPSGPQVAPFQMSPFQISPFQMSPFQISPFQMSPFQMSPFQISPFQISPLSEMAFIGLEGNEIGGTDIATAELALGGILTDGVNVAGFSANRGLEEETVLMRIDVAGTRAFVAVLGANGAYGIQPYILQLESSMPLDTAVLEAGLATELCGGSPLVGTPTQTMAVLHPNTAPLTLFVTQQERLIALYGLDAWTALRSKLVDLASHPAVHGRIISLPSNIYDGWDTNPCSMDAANGVTDQIRAQILSQLQANPSIQYVVILGSDDVVPFRRVPDESVISNERFYLMGSFLKPGTPLFSSVRQGFNLTDDFYVDLVPSPWQGRALYIPDLAIGRLAETPQEISAAASAFLTSNGRLDPTTALVSGYDFFADGAQAMADSLATRLPTVRLVNDVWSANDLRCKFLGQPSGCSAPNVAAVNAHFTHYAALSAGGFNGVNGLNFNDYLTSREVALALTADGSTALARAIVFSMGCHAGLNVPDRAASPADPGLGIDPALDFVQAMARQQAIYVASTGYGLGDDEGIGGTERLMSLFAQKLVKGDIAAGRALVSAKQRYLNSLSAMTVYDEKSSIQTTLYGLPMYRVVTNVAAAPAALQTMSLDPSFNLTLQDAATTTTSYALQQVTTASSGSYFTAGGDAQATAGRPIQPRVVVPLSSAGTSGPVHSALLTAAAFSDIPEFDPVIARPTIEWETNAPEPQICLPSYWPSELATVNSLDTAGGLLQSLVVLPGQFRCTSGSASTVVGTQRLYSDTTLELLRSNSADWEPPVVSSLDLRVVDATTVAVTIDASDPSGIARIVVLHIRNGVITSTSLAVSGTGPFIVVVPGYTTGDTLVAQVVDGAGNVASATGKGANLSVIWVNVASEITVAENSPVTLTATLPDFNSLTAPVLYIWELGDGTFTGGQTTNGTIVVQHIYPDDDPTGTPSDKYTTTVKVTDSAGGVGVAVTIVTVEDVAPVVTASVTSPINESDTSYLTGSFTDVGVRDTHRVKVDWGDGSPVEPATLTQGAGSGTFAASHRYRDDNPSGTPQDNYTVTVMVTDDDTRVGTASFVVTVKNVPPSNVAVSVNPSAINENGLTTLSGSFNDPGTQDTHTLEINWGDGSPNITINLGANVLTFNASHQYLDDNPTATASDVYNISVTVTDDDTGVGSGNTTVVVNNVVPVVTATGATMINENGTVTVSGTITDPSAKDSFTVAIAWGLGEGSTIISLPAGVTSYNASHQYLDDNPTATASDVYNIGVTVTDDDTGVGSASTTVVVNNVAPVVEAGPDQTVSWGGVVSLAPASFTDVGTRDTHTATINWGDGTATNVGTVTDTVSGSHTYAVIGQHTVTVTVTDDDGASASDTFVVTVLCTDPQGDAVSLDADLIGCTVNNDATIMTIALRVAGQVTGDFQYRIKLDANGNGVYDYHLRYDGGKVTGLPSLVASVEGNQVRFTFQLADIGRSSGGYIQFYVETQKGVPGAPDVGIADSMPNSGWFGYILR